MAIALADQYNLALKQIDFRAKVGAALMAQSIIAFSAPPNTDAITQAKRVRMASLTLGNVELFLTEFAWIVVTRPSLTTTDGLTDAFITNTVTNTFDAAAMQLIPTTDVTP